MLRYQTIESGTLELLRKLMQTDEFKELRLVGGTSLALQIGHRSSIDIDLFGILDTDQFEIDKILNKIGSITLLKKTKNINIYLIDGIKVDLVNYQSLTYFEDADTEEDPRMLMSMNWEKVKDLITISMQKYITNL